MEEKQQQQQVATVKSPTDDDVGKKRIMKDQNSRAARKRKLRKLKSGVETKVSLKQKEKESPPADIAGKNRQGVVDKVQEYLKTWEDNRLEWKFKKNIQADLIDILFDPEALRKKYFKIALEYLRGLRGAVRARVLDQARSFHDKYSTNEEPDVADGAESGEEEVPQRENPTESKSIRKVRIRTKKVLKALS